MMIPSVRAESARSSTGTKLSITAAVAVAAVALLTGCGGGSSPSALADPGEERVALAKKEGALTWYSGFDEKLSNKFAQGFKDETGIKVEVVRLGGEEVFNRVESEAQVSAVGADVATTGDAAHFVKLANDGLLRQFKSTHDADIDPKYKDPNGYYYSPYMLRFGIGYNTNQVKGSDVPQNWADVVGTTKWNGKMVASNPAFSVGAAAVPYFWDEKLGPDYIGQIAKAKPRVFQSVADALTPVEAGERSISLMAPYYIVKNAADAGSPVDIVFPKDGVPITLAGTGILKDAPHPNAAAAFTDYMMSKVGQQLFVDDNRDPASDQVTYPKGFVPLSEIQGQIFVIDPSKFSADIERIRREFTEKFGV
jgi:iron(III) transport system substrate-binding protein